MDSIRQMLAVPCEQVVDAIHGSYCDMQSICRMLARNRPLSSETFRERDRLRRDGQDLELGNSLQPHTRSRFVTCASLAVHKFRDQHLDTRCAFAPPPRSEFLVSRNDHVAAAAALEITHHAGFDVNANLQGNYYTLMREENKQACSVMSL
jgi:hypothetical protein